MSRHVLPTAPSPTTTHLQVQLISHCRNKETFGAVRAVTRCGREKLLHPEVELARQSPMRRGDACCGMCKPEV